MNILKWSTILTIIFLLGGAVSHLENNIYTLFISFIIGCCISYVGLKIADMEEGDD